MTAQADPVTWTPGEVSLLHLLLIGSCLTELSSLLFGTRFYRVGGACVSQSCVGSPESWLIGCTFGGFCGLSPLLYTYTYKFHYLMVKQWNLYLQLLRMSLNFWIILSFILCSTKQAAFINFMIPDWLKLCKLSVFWCFANEVTCK